MPNKIQIKRSIANATVTGLSNGELAFTANGNILYIGNPADGTSVRIGGLQSPGTLTANQALVANATSGIDKIIVANAAISQLNANGATGTAGQVLKSGGAGSNSYWADATATVAGSDTQVQFNDGGTLAGDAGLTYNKTTDTLSVGKAAVVNSTASSNTTTGALTVAGGLGVAGRINVTDMAIGNDTVYATVNNSVIGTNNLFATGTVNGSVLSVGGWVIANNSGVFTSGVVNGDIIRVGAQFSVNTTQVSISQGMKLSANGSLGSANQVLRSDAAGTAYWADDTGDISGVTAGNGLSGGGTSGAVTLDVGAGNGIAVDADSIRVAVGSTGGLISNATGVWINASSGLTTNATGLHIVTSGDSTLIANASGLFVNDATLSIATSQLTGDVALGTQTSGNYVATITAGNGVSGSATGEGSAPTIAVTGGSTLTVNTTGVHVNNDLSITSITTSGDATINGNTKLGDAITDVISINGVVNTNIMPAANITYNIGNNTIRWNEVHAQNVHSDYLYIDKDVSISGNLYVTGNVTTINVATLSVTDSLIQLATNNTVSDLIDIGLYGNYQTGGGDHEHTGIFRDATDGTWKLFLGLTEAPTSTVNTIGVGYTKGTLDAYLLSGGLVSNATNIAITANSTLAVALVANTLSLTTALPATSGGTGTGTYTSGDILVANTGNALSKLSLGTAGYVLQSNGTALVYDILDGGTF